LAVRAPIRTYHGTHQQAVRMGTRSGALPDQSIGGSGAGTAAFSATTNPPNASQSRVFTYKKTNSSWRGAPYEASGRLTGTESGRTRADWKGPDPLPKTALASASAVVVEAMSLRKVDGEVSVPLRLGESSGTGDSLGGATLQKQFRAPPIVVPMEASGANMFHDDDMHPTIMCSRESVAVYFPIEHGEGRGGRAGFREAGRFVRGRPLRRRSGSRRRPAAVAHSAGVTRTLPLCASKCQWPRTIQSDKGEAAGRAGFCWPDEQFCTGPSRSSQIMIPMEPSSSGTFQADGTYRTQQLCVEESQEPLYVLIQQQDGSATASLLRAAVPLGLQVLLRTTIRSWPKLSKLQPASLARTHRLRIQEGP
jgi:hypothetical protein